MAGFFDQRMPAQIGRLVNTGFPSYDYYVRKVFDQILSLGKCGAYLFAGTNMGIVRSSNNGASWTVLDNTGLPFNTFVWSFIAADSGLFAGTQRLFGSEHKVIRSTDNGETWIPVNGGLPQTSWITAFARSGASWTAVNNGLTNLGVELTNLHVISLALSGTDLIIGTDGNGAWRRPIIEMMPFVTDPTEFSLMQNYPNPFNSSTTIRFLIPEACFVRLKIFDVLGREVAKLVDQELLPGVFDIQFNGADLPSGVYFDRLEAGSFVKTRKFTLLK